MSSSRYSYSQSPEGLKLSVNEQTIENDSIAKVMAFKDTYRCEITNRAALELFRVGLAHYKGSGWGFLSTMQQASP